MTTKSLQKLLEQNILEINLGPVVTINLTTVNYSLGLSLVSSSSISVVTDLTWDTKAFLTKSSTSIKGLIHNSLWS